MTQRIVTHLGEVGHVGGVLRPIDFTIQRDGATWVLTGYTSPVLRVWDPRTHNVVALNGTTTINDDVTGEIRYTPGTSDPLHAAAGTYEAVVWVTPPGGGDPEPSALFRFDIGPGPSPA